MKHDLIVSVPGEEPILYELNAERVGIGRSAENQIHIDVETISSSHAEIRKVEDGYEIVDLKSKNGVRVNGLQADEPIHLDDGDRVLIGETVPAYFVAVAEGAEPEPAVEIGSDSDQKTAATYVSLDEKVREMERKLNAVRAQLDEKQEQYAKLESSIAALRTDIDAKTTAGANPAEIGELKKDLIQKTQQVSVLKSDIEKTEKKVSVLEATAKTTLKVPPSAAPPVAPVAPAPAPVAPQGPLVSPKITPLKPSSAGALPPNVAPLKPPTPAVPLPPATPKKPPGV